MNTRKITAFFVLGVASALLLVHAHTRCPLITPFLGSSAAAETPLPPTFHVKYLPNMYGHDDINWQRFEITPPVFTVPLDMHVSFVVDDNGADYVISSPQPWHRPTSFKIQIVNTPLALPVKNKFQTYHFAFVGQTRFSVDKTLTFTHSSWGRGIIEVMNGGGEGRIGDQLPLFDQEVEDTSFRGNTKHWNHVGYTKRFPSGMVHRMTIYFSFQPRTGAKPTKITLHSNPITIHQDY